MLTQDLWGSDGAHSVPESCAHWLQAATGGWRTRVPRRRDRHRLPGTTSENGAMPARRQTPSPSKRHEG